MKKSIFTALLFLSLSFAGFSQSFYDFTVADIDGNEFPLSQLEGKKIMVVNVASKCGYTPQYEGLQDLYEKYKDKDFVIIGFPANNFLKQEPGSNEEIKSFCTLEYGVTFPMMAKISVKGDDMAPIYKWLTSKDLNKKTDSSVKWNFQKYLISADGQLDQVVKPKVKPNDEMIIKWIED